jgi:hypothetical protein
VVLIASAIEEVSKLESTFEIAPCMAGHPQDETFSLEQSIWQADAISVFLFPVMLFRENLFEPMRLLLSETLIRQLSLVTDNKLFAATVTPDDSHLFQSRRLVATLALLYCHCRHL